MKVQNTFTFIISRNFGHPVSWSLPAWRVYLGSALLGVLVVTLTVLALLFFAVYPRMLQLDREREELKIQRDALREQLLSLSQEAFELKEQWLAKQAEGRGRNNRESGLSPEQTESSEEFQPLIQITSVTTKVNRKFVEVVFRITGHDNVSRGRGGFLFAIFENKDRQPAYYVASPNVKLNPEGFPQTYKSGIRFSRVRNTITYRRKVKRQGSEDYFTHVTLFLFSLRGGLLVKDRFTLNTDLFRKDAPENSTQSLLNS